MTDELVESPDNPGEERKARYYASLQSSCDLINEIIAGTRNEHDSDEDKKDRVRRNVEHLKIMRDKTYWDASHDMTNTNAAITAGENYIAS
jgi:hypothetical protein